MILSSLIESYHLLVLGAIFVIKIHKNVTAAAPPLLRMIVQGIFFQFPVASLYVFVYLFTVT